MNRRTFLRSGLLVGAGLTGASALSTPSISVNEFKISTPSNVNGDSLDSVEVNFENLSLTPHYTDNSSFQVTIRVEVLDKVEDTEDTVTLTNGEANDLVPKLGTKSILVDNLDASGKDAVTGQVTVVVTQDSFQKSFSQVFTIGEYSTVSASGGDRTYTITPSDDNRKYKVHVFEQTDSFEVDNKGSEGNVDVLVVGGGGGGGGSNGEGGGGGGGAGGLVYYENYSVSNGGSYNVRVGSGGSGGSGSSEDNGGNGGDSEFDSLRAIGGGGGGSRQNTGNNGGSGGGAGQNNTQGGSALQPKTNPDANIDAGNGAPDNVTSGYGVGGGGADETGFTGGGDNGSRGGDGKDMSDKFGSSVGDNGYFAGGGAGGDNNNRSDNNRGGLGGGGDANINSGGGENATPNTGGGGGGAVEDNTDGGSGGSGIVLVRYPLEPA